MKHNKIYGLILAVLVLIFTGCNDTKENPSKEFSDSIYSFFNATTPLTVNQTGGLSCSTCVINGGVYDANGTTISVQLLKYGLPAVADPAYEYPYFVTMAPFDSKYGEVVNSIVYTDASGIATFDYVGPTGNDYEAIRGSNVIIQIVFEKPDDPLVYNDPDAPPSVILKQDILLQFR